MSLDTRVTKWLRRYLAVQAETDGPAPLRRPLNNGPAQRRMVRAARAFQTGYDGERSDGRWSLPRWAVRAVTTGRPRWAAASLRLGAKAAREERRTAP